MVIRHFMDVTGAPDFLLTFAGGQWHVSADDKKATPVAIDSNTALLAYQGNLLVVDAAGLSGALSDEDLTKAVRQIQVVKEKCRLFGEHCCCLAFMIGASGYAWCVEICLKSADS